MSNGFHSIFRLLIRRDYMGSPTMPSNESELTVRIFDGTRQLYSDKNSILYTVIDGNQKQWVRQYEDSATINFKLPFFNSLGDNYRIIASADGHYDAGYFPVALTNTHPSRLDLMLLPKSNNFNFADSRW